MTIGEVIKRLRDKKPNSYSDAQMKEWLSSLDGGIKVDILDMYEGSPEWIGYDSTTSDDTELLVKDPFAEDVYVFYLAALVDFWNREINSYNNFIQLHTSALEKFSEAYSKEHKRITTKFNYF